MRNAKGILISLSLISLLLAFVLLPFTGAIRDLTSGNATDGVWANMSADTMSAESLFASLGDSSTIWTVHLTDTHADFQTIQSAIDNSNVVYGDAIEVWNGTYNETVVLDKRLTLYSRDGANVTIVDAKGSGNAITIKTDGCTVYGFMATGSGHYPGDAGIRVESNGNIIVNSICCANNYDGISLSDSSNNTISNNYCYENKGVGIYLADCSNNIIKKNGIGHNDRDGIDLMDCTNNIIRNNEIYDNFWDGIYISQSSNNVVTNNEIYKNLQAGVHMAYSSKNRIYCNGFVNNSRNVNSHDSDSIWNSMSVYTYNGSQYTSYIGNYLSDYVGADNNSDGIGDVSYCISGELFEEAGPYGNTYFYNPGGEDLNMSYDFGDENNSDVFDDEFYFFNESYEPIIWPTDPFMSGFTEEEDTHPLIRPFKFYILENVLPSADFTFSPLEPVVNERVTFDASSSYDPDGAIILYQWDFGDGNITSTAESTMTHYYRSAADYAVTLTVTDNSSAISSTSKVITMYPL
jgi:parallel beta-helix repeat protein